MSGGRFGAVDIGTNTVRLLVADLSGSPGAPELHDRQRTSTIVRLGEGVDASRRLTDSAMERALRALAGYGEALAGWGCDAVGAVATSAVRDAANRDHFLDRAAEAVGVRPEMISGAAEAALGFAGATLGASGPPPHLVIDPGGGSTEFVMGEGAPAYAVSVDIGSVRLTERRLPRLPAAAEEVEAARRHVDGLLAAEVRLPDTPGTVVGVGGTFTTLAAVHLGIEAYRTEAVDGAVIRLDALVGGVNHLARLSVEEIAAIPAVEPRRAPVLLGGAVVAERAVAAAGAGSVTVSERDILDGVVLSLAGR